MRPGSRLCVTEVSRLPLRYVVGPDGSPLTMADLPPPNTKRWVVRSTKGSEAGTRLALFQLDSEMLEDLLFYFPSASEVLFDDECIAPFDGNWLAAIGRDDNFALDHMYEFRR